MNKRPNLKDLSLEEIEALVASVGKEKYRARQIMKWIYQKRAASFDEMTTLSKELRSYLKEAATLAGPEIVRTRTAKDTTKKFLFRLDDGLHIESVLIPGRHHWTICVSTQAGCRMGCRFCCTGTQGLKRNLLPSEITGQITALQALPKEGPDIKNIVLMGMGEPLDNYDNVVKAIGLITSDHGLGFSSRKVTLSTCGLAPLIERLGADICVNLAISLNAPDDRRRSELMPVNRRYPLKSLLESCRRYPMPGRRMLTFEYILMSGVNASAEDAKQLARLLKGIRCKLNLIAFNEFPGSPYRTPSDAEIRDFQRILAEYHYTAILRVSKGSDILAACGQLSGSASSDGTPE
ncbi:MAG TPA: 23S rRNA (adenine(2503)-C(2))-methyltransferase RlmN [Syntrophales bacterium]|nr:23S rRNA (adenine(2503)-C(2))-methyltransferase RlmN [Syntrophales bacterium]